MNQNTITYGLKTYSVAKDYYAPIATALTSPGINLFTVYGFLGNIDGWTDNTNPPLPTEDMVNIRKTYKNIFAVKQITSNNISPVIRRFDWTTNTVYTAYNDSIDMFKVDQNNSLISVFYVKNSYDQVFKCLWNNNGSPSTVEPMFEPGAYNANRIYIGSDGYKWKYMFTVDSGRKKQFMDSNWIPIPIKSLGTNPLISPSGYGDIEVINVIDGGSGYNPTMSPVSIIITGDGSNASAVPVIDSITGSITDIIVTNPGKNYTTANVSVVSNIGSGAVLSAPISPPGGHGSDLLSEFGCSNVMYTVEFNGTENGIIPVDITYYQTGLIINPTTLENTPNPANGSIYRTTTDITVFPGFGAYVNGEMVYQGTNLENSSFSGQVVYFDVGSNLINLINIKGTPTINQSLFGDTSQTTRTLASSSISNFELMSGYIAYIENRSGITRSSDGIEQFRFVLQY